MDDDRAWYEYSVESNGDRTSQKLKLMVSYDNDIFGAIIDHLRNEMFIEQIINNRIERWASFSEIKDSFYRQSMGITREEIEQTDNIDQLRFVIIPDYVVYNRYTITGIKRVDGCNACLIDDPEQLCHTSCPYGCLHDKSICAVCKADFDNTINDDILR